MEHHTQTLHRRLGELHGLRQQTHAVENKILKAATDRLDRVNTDIEKIRNRALVDERVSSHYESLILERGRLQQVIANSREHLS